MRNRVKIRCKFFAVLFVLVIGCSVSQKIVKKQPKVLPEVVPEILLQVGQLDMEYMKRKCPIIRTQYLMNNTVILFTLQYLRDPTIGIVQVFFDRRAKKYATYRYLKGNELFLFVLTAPDIFKRYPIPEKNYDAVRDELLRYKNGINV